MGLLTMYGWFKTIPQNSAIRQSCDVVEMAKMVDFLFCLLPFCNINSTYDKNSLEVVVFQDTKRTKQSANSTVTRKPLALVFDGDGVFLNLLITLPLNLSLGRGEKQVPEA